jgi:hypothetical protein
MLNGHLADAVEQVLAGDESIQAAQKLEGTL